MNRAGIAEKTAPGARRALALLLGINLFNYIDRYILAAVEPEIRRTFFTDPHSAEAMAKTGSLATAFLLSYMLTAPLFGWLADRTSRWLIVGGGVALWSLASAGSGLATTFGLLLGTRLFVGLGEAAYGPAAPTIIADYFSLKVRGRMMSFFYVAIPVGSAIGYAFGGKISAIFHDWRWPFYLVAPPGLILAALCFFMREPRRAERERVQVSKLVAWKKLLTTPSYVFNTLAMAAMTFAIGGLSFWVPGYIYEFRGEPDLGAINLRFGLITVVAGLIATLLGGFVGDKVRERRQGAYFLVSGLAMLMAFPFVVGFLFVPFPWAWLLLFGAVFFIFFNTGPSNTALANVTHPSIRATAFALNIFIIHAAGDAISPPLIGAIAGRWNMNAAFLVVSAMILLGAALWLLGARFLGADTGRIERGEF
jgi:MFS family permease